MALLKLSAISRAEGAFTLDNIAFSQKKGEHIAIAGETGSGKSTLLKIIAGLAQPDSGTVLFNGKKVDGPGETLVPGHPHIAYLSQQFELQKFLRVEQILSYANTLHENTASKLFRLCQIDHLLTRGSNQLSGGERQRIALCSLLIRSPGLLLLDEPFAHLDTPHKATLRKVIDDISRELKITCILVSHDPDDILSWADRILVMRDGRIIQSGNPETVYRKPLDTYCASLFGPYNVIDTNVADALKITIPRGRACLLRPEDLSLSLKGRKSLGCRVREINFFGGYYLATVHLLGASLQVRTINKLRAGSHCFLTLQGDPHFLRENFRPSTVDE